MMATAGNNWAIINSYHRGGDMYIVLEFLAEFSL